MSSLYRKSIGSAEAFLPHSFYLCKINGEGETWGWLPFRLVHHPDQFFILIKIILSALHWYNLWFTCIALEYHIIITWCKYLYSLKICLLKKKPVQPCLVWLNSAMIHNPSSSAHALMLHGGGTRTRWELPRWEGACPGIGMFKSWRAAQWSLVSWNDEAVLNAQLWAHTWLPSFFPGPGTSSVLVFCLLKAVGPRFNFSFRLGKGVNNFILIRVAWIS